MVVAARGAKRRNSTPLTDSKRQSCDDPARIRLEAAKAAFRRSGFVVLEGLLNEAHLTALRDECSRVVDDAYDTVHRLSEPNPVPSDWVLRNHGCVFPVPVAATAHPPCCARDYRKVRGAGLRPTRRVRGQWGGSGSGNNSDGSEGSGGEKRAEGTGVADLLFSSQLRTLVEVLLGGPAWLYNEQYIVKPPSCDGAAFQWHRDSDVCAAGVQARPYLSVWCALDDVHEDNGTLFVQPYPPTPPPPRSDAVIHHDDGLPVIIPAGGVVVMSDRVLHCSGGNFSGKPRRAWMPQFSQGPVYKHVVCDATKTTVVSPAALAVPLTDTRAAEEEADY